MFNIYLSRSNFFLKSKIVRGYTNDHVCYIKQRKHCLYELKAHSYSNYASINTRVLCPLLYNKYGYNKNDPLSRHVKRCLSNLLNVNKTFCTDSLVKNANVFGDLSYEKYEKVEMDDDEIKEERFMENDARIPRWQKLSLGQYCDLIISHIGKKDLNQALSVLDLVKANRDKPNIYMYLLLIRAFALQGNIKVCFKLYNKLKDYNLTPTPAIYNSLINVCAVSKDKKTALMYLHRLREYFHEHNYSLNETHYITLIKAYSWHQEMKTAFELADEAQDKHLFTKDTYACLFHSAISNKESGLIYALILWHKMKEHKIRPNLTHYNLLLRAIRDTKFGDLKVNDILQRNLAGTQIQLIETGKPDLLQSPPVLSTMCFQMIKEQTQNKSIDVVSKNNDSKAVVTTEAILSQSLNDILEMNKLLLFGGVEKLFTQMESDNVIPDEKTLTIMLELLPPSTHIENIYLKHIESKKLKTDITLYNMLIKRRNNRKQYKAAKDVINEIQRHHLIPNIITFGVLALGCTSLRQGAELLEQMNMIGFTPNSIVLDILMQRACRSKNFKYVQFLMNYISEYHMKPSKYMLDTLEKFEKLVLEYIKTENRYNRKEIRYAKKNYNEFKIYYNEWKQRVQKM
ncbi:pentatricopeptide repeat-containing protein 1, mitochondrial [Colletes gigas]|uniref:pentatricopeptide repeat-containing protein 1, mitochondrial n=1 Tax=Colletes gigas TaxID=935657 RepID=UPI001C9B5CD0|nr:pentatricopeptide repeat-containing protein 1, mitochondrial [Colletes gigas]